MSGADSAGLPPSALELDEYEEIVIFEEWRRLRRVSSRSLQRTSALLHLMGCRPEAPPHRTVGVVGSKGKGTAAAYASAALAGLGHRVGTVMSPGVLSNADRIRIDGDAVDAATRRSALERIHQARRQLPAPTAESGYLAPTGLFMVMAMLIFAEAGVDVVVAEAGIGGASDDLSHWRLDGVVVSEIFAEHLDLLGPTIADVAADKAAVITESTQFCISASQASEPAAVIQARCTATGTTLGEATNLAHRLVGHLPAGLQRDNAAIGVTAGLRLSRTDDPDLGRLGRVLCSVHYPGRLSTHTTAGGRGCVVDSAVTGAGLSAALDFAEQQLGRVDQVLVCLPPGKDLAGFIQVLETFPGSKIFVELPGAYTGMPQRGHWPWLWRRDDDVAQLLESGSSLAVGTVLYTSHVLGVLGADADRLFTR